MRSEVKKEVRARGAGSWKAFSGACNKTHRSKLHLAKGFPMGNPKKKKQKRRKAVLGRGTRRVVLGVGKSAACEFYKLSTEAPQLKQKRCRA